MNPEMAVRQLICLARFTEDKKIRLAAEWNEPWKVLIATILSAQNQDSRTIEVCENYLFKKYTTPAKLGNAKIELIEKLIHSINYYKTKARHIKETARIISAERIGDSVEDLVRLPGVGRKTANVFLAEVHTLPAIGVDTHVKRISRKLGWTKNTNPHKIEKDLEKLFPRRYWNSINTIVVRFGQTIGRSSKREDEVLGNLK